MGEIISIECHDEFDPQIVRVFIRGPNGIVYAVDFDRRDYDVLAMLPGFPPDPCNKK